MVYLTSKQVEFNDLSKFRDKCGKLDYVTFLQPSGRTYYMLSENKSLGYIGLTIIENNEVLAEVFFQSDEELLSLVSNHSFSWDMSAEEKSKILAEYCY